MSDYYDILAAYNEWEDITDTLREMKREVERWVDEYFDMIIARDDNKLPKDILTTQSDLGMAESFARHAEKGLTKLYKESKKR